MGLQLLYAEKHFFPYPTPLATKISGVPGTPEILVARGVGCSLSSTSAMLDSALCREKKADAIISHEIFFWLKYYTNLCDHESTIPQRYRQTVE